MSSISAFNQPEAGKTPASGWNFTVISDLRRSLKIPAFDAARIYALDRLARELAPSLVYHSLAHTRDTVMPLASKLAVMEGLPAYQQELVNTGAAFHDLGFVSQYTGHEAVGARIAHEKLPGFGFSSEEIQTIECMIMATVLPQSPHTLLECIVADADLSILGQDIFLERNADLRREQASIGRVFSDSEWYNTQLKFIQRHRYFTASARALLDARKAVNAAALTALLSESAVLKQD